MMETYLEENMDNEKESGVNECRQVEMMAKIVLKCIRPMP